MEYIHIGPNDRSSGPRGCFITRSHIRVQVYVLYRSKGHFYFFFRFSCIHAVTRFPRRNATQAFSWPPINDVDLCVCVCVCVCIIVLYTCVPIYTTPFNAAPFSGNFVHILSFSYFFFLTSFFLCSWTLSPSFLADDEELLGVAILSLR